jgi:hypothetical protein
MIGNPFLRVAGSRGADRPEAKNVAIIAEKRTRRSRKIEASH